MINSISGFLTKPKLDKRSARLFVLIGLTILAFSLLSWEYEIKPRLINEAISNMQLMSDSRAKSIEAQFQNLNEQSDLTVIHNSINELLLLIDPTTGQNIFAGIELEIDIDVLPLKADSYNLQVGTTPCNQCIKTESPIYNRVSGELIGIIKIYANSVLYQRLVYDIGKRLAIVLCGVLLVILLAWVLTSRLLVKLQQREIHLTREISERKTIEERLHQIATYDQLTNLPNRYLLHTEFKQKLEEAQRYNKKLAVLFIDLDHFKMVNDIYGHETGDILLEQVALRISKLVRGYDLLARFGGDEFVMIMPHLDDHSEAYTVVEKIIDSFNHEYNLGEVKVNITTSIGISVYPDDGDTPSTLLKNADLAMYRAKSDGRNMYHFFTPKMNQDLERSQWIETNLKLAIEHHDLQLYFQPQQDLKTGEIISCEALLRWPQDDGTMISPLEFIPVAERTGLINRLSKWVFDEAYTYQNRWRQKGYKKIRTDINLSVKDFSKNEVISEIINLLTHDKNLTQKIGIEITENILLKSSDEILESLKHLYDSTLHISIDDFGTGYSSMNYLKKFPVSCLKIDQTFVKESPDNLQDQSIMQAFVSVGHALGMTVIAEGVETVAHNELTRGIDCDMVQGYYLSRPLPAQEFEVRFLKP